MLDLKDVWTEYKHTQDPALREKIIIDCMPLVKYVVGKVAASAPRGCDREDLIQCGIFGLIDAVERYDPNKDTRFETYVILRVRGAVVDELRTRDWTPRGRRKMAREIQTITCELESRDGSVPTVDDLARKMGLSRRQMEETLQKVSVVSFVSIDEARSSHAADSSGKGTRFGDMLEDRRTPQPSDGIELDEKLCSLGQSIAELPEQERIIITLYYYKGMRLRDIAELYGVSESRISQIHGRALNILRLKMHELVGSS